MRSILSGFSLVSLFLVAPAGAQTAEFPFFDGFESGGLAPHWTVTKQWGEGKATVSTSSGPWSGTYHLLVDGPETALDSNVTVDLRIDLAGASSVLLEFVVKEFQDEYAPTPSGWLGTNQYYDGVFVSDDDGATWVEVLPLDESNTGQAYQKHTIELDPVVAAAGMAYNDHFLVRFSWEDENQIDVDGMAFDEISLRSLDYATVATIESTVPTSAGAFGAAMTGIADIDGDGFRDLAVGHPGYGSLRGRVELYSGLTGASLGQFSTDVLADQFGSTLANLGDLNGDGKDELLVGAPFNDTGGKDAGAAYIYDSAAGQQLHAFYGLATGDEFGSALCAVPDITGDGLAEACVGAPEASGALGTLTGRVQVFSSFDQSLVLDLEGPQQGGRMGTSVDAFGDADGDGLADLILGSPTWDFIPILKDESGAAFVYSTGSGALLRSFAGDFAGGRFGAAVLGLGDVNDDDVGDFAVGAPDRDGLRGMVRFFSGATGALLGEDSGKAEGELFGYVLTRAGDIDGDGEGDVAAGSDSAALGTVRVYQLPSLETLVDIEPVQPATGFGRSIAGVGDLNLDGLGDMAIAAPFEEAELVENAGLVRVVSTADAPQLSGVVGVHSLLSGQAVLSGTNLLANLEVRVAGEPVPVQYVSPVEALIDVDPIMPGGFFDVTVLTGLGNSTLPRGLARFPALHAPSEAAAGENVLVELENGEPGSYVLAFSGQKYPEPAPFEAWGWYHGLELNGVWFAATGGFSEGDTLRHFSMAAPAGAGMVGETFHLQAWTYQAETQAVGFTDTMSVTITP